MTVEFDRITSAVVDNADFITISHTVSAGNNMVVIGTGGGRGGAAHAITSARWNGNEMTAILGSQYLNPIHNRSFYYVLGNTAGVTADLTIYFGNSSRRNAVAASYRNVDQTIPVGSVSEHTSTGTSVALTVSSVVDGLVVDAVAIDIDQATDLAAGDTDRDRASFSNEAASNRISLAFGDSDGATTVSTGWTWSATEQAAHHAFTIYPAAAGGTVNSANVAFPGTGSFVVIGDIFRQGTAAFAGTGTFTATGDQKIQYAGTAAFAGTGTFTATGTTTTENAGTAAFAGAGTFTAAGTVTRAGTAAFAGTGTFTATGAVEGANVGIAAFAGAGSFTASASVTWKATSAFAGAGSFTATGSPNRPAVPATMAGAGSFAVTGHVNRAGTFVASGAGALSVGSHLDLKATAAFAGAGSFAATASVDLGSFLGPEYTATLQTADLTATLQTADLVATIDTSNSSVTL